MTTFYITDRSLRSGICDIYATDLRVAHASSHLAENPQFWRHVGYANAAGKLCVFHGTPEDAEALADREPLQGGNVIVVED